MEGEGRGGGKPDDRWGLASFFGEEQHALLRLRDETRDILVDLVATEYKDHGVMVLLMLLLLPLLLARVWRREYYRPNPQGGLEMMMMVKPARNRWPPWMCQLHPQNPSCNL